MLISLIVPCYNEEESLPHLYNALCEVRDSDVCQDKTFEFIFINDGSSDKTAELIRDYAASDPCVRYVLFSRNFGKEAAMYAGLQKAKGDYVAIMDADMQDPPSLIPEMITSLDADECDIVAARRVTREGEPKIRSFFARSFYRIINKMCDVEIADGARDFRLMKRKVVDAILKVTERQRFSKGIFAWVGFRTKWIEHVNTPRVAGETKWSFWKLFLYALDGIVAFSTVPLGFASVLGILFCIVSFILIVAIIIKTLILGDPTSGWPSMVCIISLISGVQLLCLGIFGQYLSKTYLEVKDRPIYISKEEF